jgi:5-methylcytosine-specific restriction endonuclease McrA
MIKLTRKEAPAVIKDKLEQQTKEYIAFLDEGVGPPQALLDAYKERRLKEHLMAETHGKCAYCESKICHSYFGDVEHMLSKKHKPKLRLNLSNLTIACAVCNNNKRDYFSDVLPIINPFEDDPSIEFIAVGSLIKWQAGRDRAKITAMQLKLNRPALIERRNERIQGLFELVDTYMMEPSGPMREVLKEQLEIEMAEESEYTFVVRKYLNGVLFTGEDVTRLPVA